MRQDIIVFLTILSFTLSPAYCDDLQKCNKLNHEAEDSCEKIERVCKPFNPNDASVIVNDSGGRLGNHMFVYLLLASLKLKYGMQPYLTRKTKDILGPIFEDLGMEVAEEELCDFDVVYPKFL